MNSYVVGQKVQVVQSMAFVGMPPSVARESHVTKATRCFVWIKGRAWTDGKFNPDERYHANSKAIGSPEWSIRGLHDVMQFNWVAPRLVRSGLHMGQVMELINQLSVSNPHQTYETRPTMVD